MKALRLNLLGGVHARDAADHDIAIAGTKATLLLAYLALKPGKPHSRETLIGLLWSDRGDNQARGSLRQALWSLGQALKNFDPCPLKIDGEMISLDPAAVAIRPPGGEGSRLSTEYPLSTWDSKNRNGSSVTALTKNAVYGLLPVTARYPAPTLASHSIP